MITWAIGHLIELAEPDQYDDKYKKWSIDHLPIIQQEFKLVPNPRTIDQLKVIAELAKRCDRLVNACDAGREGQQTASCAVTNLFSLINERNCCFVHNPMCAPPPFLYFHFNRFRSLHNIFYRLNNGIVIVCNKHPSVF
jgi:hypothetical protein